MEESVGMIKTIYLSTNTSSSYNMIIGKCAFNILGGSLSTLYMCMKYYLPNGRVEVAQDDQETSKMCYLYKLKLKKKTMVGYIPNSQKRKR